LQVLAIKINFTGTKTFEDINGLFKRGDIVGIEGKPGKSKTGELSIYAYSLQLLSPCLHMLPS